MVFILFAYVGLILLRQICCISSYYVTSIRWQQTNNEEYLAFLLPNALYDGGVVVYYHVI